MILNLSVILLFLIILIVLSFVLFFLILLSSYRNHKRKQFKENIRNTIKNGINLIETDSNIKLKKMIELLTDLYENIDITVKEKKHISDILKSIRAERFYRHRINSLFSLKRTEAAYQLGIIQTEAALNLLEERLSIEKDYTVKLYIIEGLTKAGLQKHIPLIIDTLFGAPSWYTERVNQLIIDYGDLFCDYLPEIIQGDRLEEVLLITQAGEKIINPLLKEYLFKQITHSSKTIRRQAYEGILKNYYFEIANTAHFTGDPEIDRYIIIAISKSPTSNSINMLLPYISKQGYGDEIIYSLSIMCRKNPKLLSDMIELFSTRQDYKPEVAQVLAGRLEYFLLKINSNRKDKIKELINYLIKLNKTSELIGFLNKNQDREVENEILAVIKNNLDNAFFRNELSSYLSSRILKKLNLEPKEHAKAKREEQKEKSKVRFLYVLLIPAFLILPLLSFIGRYSLIGHIGLVEMIKLFVIDYNFYLIFYSFTINLIYYIMLCFSFLGADRQYRAWKIKPNAFLFKRKMLPSISIIAPAYCEEATIIESCNSLLNLKYPDYELIVVNDGSSDNTLKTLIDYYNLHKVDTTINLKLNTKPVRGVYINKTMPRLVVVDKENGGKADSLNVGINISRKEYFCGIDADSLLEPDALLKAASMALNSKKEFVAVGGNILPVNGCEISKGYIQKIALPKNLLARFQAIEYIRAFIAGRIGWAYINSLLIISGAFGLFKKERVIEIGGYLTSSSRYKKDTVGEDMELVVRLSKYLKEQKIPFEVEYAFNANCWTEVPESFNILYKQRDRWHRGLIDILSFHRNILFNPRYGSLGLIAFPYFFLFEMLGPLIEFQGYIMVVLAAVFGLLNVGIALLLFITTILMGIIISLSSLLILKSKINLFKLKETLHLILLSIIENFGFRQIMSFIRVLGYFSSMKKPKGWGKMTRKGFVKQT